MKVIRQSCDFCGHEFPDQILSVTVGVYAEVLDQYRRAVEPLGARWACEMCRLHAADLLKVDENWKGTT